MQRLDNMKIFTITKADQVMDNGDDLPLEVTGPEEMECSDGYHTFGELYDHRITLFIALCRMTDNIDRIGDYGSEDLTVWRSKYHSDGELAFGGIWFVLGINKEPGKQITYHLPIERWEETNFAETLDKAPAYDDHTSEDVLQRLKRL